MAIDNVTSSTCSSISAMVGEDPIGTAATHERYLFVEVPLPWSYPIVTSQHVPQQLVQLLDEVGENDLNIRFQAFTSDRPTSPDGFRKVFYFQKPAAAFARYAKQEFVIPEVELPGLAKQLIFTPEEAQSYRDYMVDSSQIRELFVCTHGAHDQCCGALGIPLYQQLEEKYASPDQLRVWRVSHLGGHRFAPTILDLPDGRFWARIATEDLDQLVHRKGSFSEIASKYRGWGGVGKMEQHLERELLIREGWVGIDWLKSGTSVSAEDGTVTITIDYAAADGSVSGSYVGKLMPTHRVKVTGGCGKPLEDMQMFELKDVVKRTS